MGLCGDQAEARVLPLGERSDARVGIESELFTQLLGVGHVPARIKGLRISQQLPNAHPSRQLRLFRQIADVPQDRHRVRDGILAEHPDGSCFSTPQAEQVFEQR
jgi:hypothetical protein